MADPQPLEPLVQMDIVKVTAGGPVRETDVVATEVPVTIMTADTEIATLMCTPEHLDDLARGFLYTSGLVANPLDFQGCEVDPATWTVRVALACTVEPEQLSRRTFTSGCGKGVMFASALELAGSTPLPAGFTFRRTCPGTGQLVQALFGPASGHGRGAHRRLERGGRGAAAYPR
jgi:Uncharacterized protein required for formate dehydrogenase activity